ERRRNGQCCRRRLRGRSTPVTGLTTMIDVVRRTLLISAATLCLAAPVAAQQDSLEQQFDRALPSQGQVPSASQPVVQPLAAQQPPFPVQPWPVADARGLLGIIEGIGAEGLDPRDYRPEALRQAVALGPSPELDQLASEMF